MWLVDLMRCSGVAVCKLYLLCSGALLMAHCHPVMMVQRIHQVPYLQLAQQAHAPDAFVLLALTQQHPNSQHMMNKPGRSLAALVLTKDHMFVGTSIGPAIQVERSAFAAGVCSFGASAIHTYCIGLFGLSSRTTDIAKPHRVSLQSDARCSLTENAVWPQEPLLAPMVAGNMAIGVDVQTGSIIWDLQKVPVTNDGPGACLWYQHVWL